MIKKIVLTSVALCIAILTLIIISINSSSGITVNVEIIKNDQIEETTLYIPEESSFVKEIVKVYDVLIEDGFLHKIDFLEVYNISYAYIAIYVNDSYSSYGINNLKLNDNDTVSFVYTLV